MKFVAAAVVGLALIVPAAPSHAAAPEPSVGTPVAPYQAGSPATGRIEVRAADPDGGPPLALLSFRHHGRRCVATGTERSLRSYPTREGGQCVPIGRDPGPITTSVSAGGRQPIVVAGRVSPAVTALTVSRPDGSTAAVPRSQTGNFLVVYRRSAQGEAVLTAGLADGTTRVAVVPLPPAFDPPGRALAPDPLGGAPWLAVAGRQRAGAGRGQTCAEASQRPDLSGARVLPFIGSVCGDLDRAGVIADVGVAAPARGRDSRPGDAAQQRLVLWGAAGQDVAAVAVDGPDGRRVLALGGPRRAFVAVYPAGVRPEDLTLEVRSADGTSRRHVAPRRLGVAPSAAPPPRLRRVDVAVTPSAPRTLVVSIVLAAPAQRVTVAVGDRTVTLRSVGRDPRRWRASVALPDVPPAGRRYLVRSVVCAATCAVRERRATVRAEHER